MTIFSGNDKILAYPNPVKKGKTLQVRLQNTAASKIEIINASGLVVYRNSGTINGFMQIPISTYFSPGQYVLRVISNNTVKTKKILVQ